MHEEFITQSEKETKELGRLLARELKGGEVVCLCGDLGAGKTTFTQGLLEALGAEKPYTSPTFVIMKKYKTKRQVTSDKGQGVGRKIRTTSDRNICTVYHFDAYRVGTEDVLALGWEELSDDPENVCIVEWADRISPIIPYQALWIGFEWLDEKRRKLTLRQE